MNSCQVDPMDSEGENVRATRERSCRVCSVAPVEKEAGDALHLARPLRLTDPSGLKLGIDPDSADRQGFTALHFAAQQSSVEAAALAYRGYLWAQTGCTRMSMS